MIGAAVPWYLSPNFLPAAFGLLGVVIGGLITAVSSYLLEERRGKREQQREDRERSIEIKRAARMIAADFAQAHACASLALDQRFYWDSSNAPLKLKGWEDYAAILAPAILSDAWLKVRLGVDAISNLNAYREMDAASATNKVRPPVSNELNKALASAAHDISDAQEALAPLCYESRSRFLAARARTAAASI